MPLFAADIEDIMWIQTRMNTVPVTQRQVTCGKSHVLSHWDLYHSCLTFRNLNREKKIRHQKSGS